MKVALATSSRRFFAATKHSRGLNLALAARWNSTSTRQWSTPLAKSLADAITTTGPVSIANYMRQCLTSTLGGYYTTRSEAGTDQFGKTGDFVTSPEISQIFGELVGIWFVAEWMAQGKPSSGVQLVELGPGRGTLMSDVLRTMRNFKPMASALEAIYLVEASPTLRETQKELLCGSVNIQEHEIGYQGTSQHVDGVSVIWTEDISFITKDRSATPFIVAHEFFDALPIHAFQSAPQVQSNPQITTSVASQPPRPRDGKANEWRELVVSVAPPPSVINPPKEPGLEFQMTLSPIKTHHSQLLPNLSPRYKALLPKAGSTIEISPNAQTTATHIAHMIGGDTSATSAQEPQSRPRGAALIVDYGPSDTIPVNSLRGIRSHKRVSPFSAPGQTDLSVDVDFGALAETALASSPHVEVHGPVEQGAWLMQMGGKERADMLMKAAERGDAKEGEELKDRINSGWKRLVDRGINGMGKLYKVMAILPQREGQEGRRPVGFGGDV